MSDSGGREATGNSGLAQWAEMARIRAFEQACFDFSTSNPPQIAGSIHLCAGQEAVPVGAARALRQGDSVVATYRGHGWALATGLPIHGVFAEVCHRADGINGGRAGSAYLMAPWAGFIGENSIVGAGLPIGCGVALAASRAGSGAVTLVSFGDGASSQGAVHEAMVTAAYLKLPIVFICENNDWSEMTALSAILAVDRVARRAGGYGIPGATVDGTDPLVVEDAVRLAVENARAGKGPSFIEFKLPRLWGHYNRDIEHYRPKADRAAAEARDPLLTFGQKLISEGHMISETLEDIRNQVTGEMAALATTVLASAQPDPNEARAQTLGPPARREARPDAKVETMTYVQAVNTALRDALAERDDTLLYGEDVGRAGGIFGASRYLQRDFGEQRVFDMPIAESAILGTAVGAALAGWRPIVEIMWADFILVALDQLINQAANVRAMTGGRSTVPMVVRTQQGATPGSCAQHSQSLEALLAHIPGLKLGLPSCPQDAYSMLRLAVEDPDPVIIIEARSLYQDKGEVDPGCEDIIGRARVLREGHDVALIGWGTIVRHLAVAAEVLAGEGIAAHILDLRWLNPLDQEAVDDAVVRCGGRAVIAHEANLTGGFGAEICARIAERHPGARLRRVGTPDVRMPASPVLQAALLPNAPAIVTAARALCTKDYAEADR